MADRLVLLFAEVDRQLDEVREQATALATRAGLTLAAVAVAGAVLAARIEKDGVEGLTPAFWPLGLATVAGIVALVPAVTVGPSATALTSWATATPAGQAVTQLLAAKLLTLEGNRTRLVVMTYGFYVEVVAAVVAVVLSLVVSSGK